MTASPPPQLDGLINAFLKRDLEAALAYFADDAVFYDPHYPIPEMKGIAAIRQGLAWGLGNLEKPGFTIRNWWGNGESGAVELHTHHVFKGGMAVEFDQVFVFELQDGKITRLQSYVPYGPGGIGGVMAKATYLGWKLKGKV